MGKKTDALKKNSEFVRVFKRGRYQASNTLTIHIMQNGSCRNRLGITSSRKIGGSVQRNRIKRLIRENYRIFEVFVPVGFDIVVTARKTDEMPDFWKISRDMKYVLKKLGFFDKEKWECQKNVVMEKPQEL